MRTLSVLWRGVCILGIVCECFLLGESQDARHLLTPYYGEARVLPTNVEIAVELLRAHRIQTFSASAEMTDDMETFQRLTEGAYPTRMIKDSPYLISLKKDVAGCAVIDVRESVYLLQCQKSQKN